MTCFVVTGTVGSVIMLFGSKFLAGTVCNNPGAFLSVIMLSPAVFFLCMTSAYRGYYQGLRNMYPTAISQVIEAVVKVGVGLTMTLLVYNWGIKVYEEKGSFYGIDLGISTESLTAQSAVAPVAAAQIGMEMLMRAPESPNRSLWMHRRQPPSGCCSKHS